ncbi:uncharacterized protein DEA37_0001423 [Paragonimus westermani]|uniref:Uncharacterized protein n=1 Tax=Paragonimus westermani TaxID=34504 RepID=A0A5J4N361_9TREM|nr:uncharacterized protein DEA37_0001423 [Paragonimus westermani]
MVFTPSLRTGPQNVGQTTSSLRLYQDHILNDRLYQGLDVTTELIGVLVRFRAERITVVADTDEMVLQASVSENDRAACLFLRCTEDDLNMHLIECQTRTHSFQAICTLFVLTSAIMIISFNDMTNRAAKYDFYVENCLKSL